MNIAKMMMAVTVMAVGLGGASIISQPAERQATDNERQMAKQIALLEEQISETAVSAKKETASTAKTDIGKEEAIRIALGHAGLSESEVKYLRAERDYDHGRLKYDVEFRVGRLEYEYEIDGTKGSILEYDVEKDD